MGIREALPEITLFGSEIFATGLSFAAQRLPGVELFQMDARRIPFREEFDVGSLGVVPVNTQRRRHSADGLPTFFLLE